MKIQSYSAILISIFILQTANAAEKEFDCGRSLCGCQKEVEVVYKSTILSSDLIPQPNIKVRGSDNRLLTTSDSLGKLDFTLKTIAHDYCGWGALTLSKETPSRYESWIIMIDMTPMQRNLIILNEPYQKAERTNGENDGIWQEWCAGQLRVSGSFKKGLKDGVWTAWNCTGEKKSKGEYRFGKKEGILIEWYPSGQIRRQSEWHDGKLNGKLITWFPDGQIMAEIAMRDNKRYGKSTYYSKDGTKITTEPFEYLNLDSFPYTE